MAEIQILIAAYGEEDLKRIASLPHPQIEGVEYLVGWQNYGEGTIPDTLLKRPDFKILLNNSSGLCKNRNYLLEKADGDIVVISDSDLSYTTRNIETIKEAFRKYADYDFLTFKFSSDEALKTNPKHAFDFENIPKGYYVASVELTLNLKRIKKHGNLKDWLFNTNFGINGNLFGSGEEDILIAKVLKKGYRGRYIPEEICHHPGGTTSDRLEYTREFIEAKGAVFTFVKPRTWFLRMLMHAWRTRKAGTSFLDYCRWWLSGARKAKTNHVFAHEK